MCSVVCVAEWLKMEIRLSLLYLTKLIMVILVFLNFFRQRHVGCFEILCGYVGCLRFSCALSISYNGVRNTTNSDQVLLLLLPILFPYHGALHD